MTRPLALDVVVKKNSKALNDLADDFDRTINKVDAAGKSMDRTTKFSSYLDDQLAGTREQVHRLGDEFDRTGSKDVFANLRGAEANLKKLEAVSRQLSPALERPVRDLETLAAEFRRNQEQTDDFGDKLNKTTTFAKYLAGQLAAAQVQVRNLGAEFKRTGDASVLSKLLDVRADAKALESLGAEVKGATVAGLRDGGKEGFSALAKIAPSSLSGILGTPVVGPLFGAALIGGVAVAAPAITATLGAAVIGAGGLGLIAGGIAAQIKSPVVANALSDLGQDAGDIFKRATSPFASPLAAGFRQADAELVKLGPDLDRIFGRVAPLTQDLFGGLTKGIDKLEPGFDALSRAAGPVIRELSADIPRLAGAFSEFLSDVSDGTPGAVLALHDLVTVIDFLVVSTGRMIEGGEKLYSFFRFFANESDSTTAALQLSGRQADDTGQSFEGLAQKVGDAVPSLEDLQKQLNSTAVTADTLAGQMTDKVLAGLMSSDQATLGWYESLTKLSDSIKENGKALDIHTAKGQANREAVLSVVSANIQGYDTMIQSGISAKDAAAAYDQNTAALERQLRKAGLTSAQVNDLIGKYKNVPGKVNTDLAIHGLTDAINNLADLIRQINGLKSKTITIRTVQQLVTVRGQETKDYAMGGVRRAAVGMVLAPSDPGTVLAAEPQTGGEVLAPLRGISRSRAMGLAQVIGDSYGFDVGGSRYGSAMSIASGRGSAAAGNDVIGVLRVDHYGPDGEYMRSELLKLARRKGYRSAPQLFPVGS